MGYGYIKKLQKFWESKINVSLGLVLVQIQHWLKDMTSSGIFTNRSFQAMRAERKLANQGRLREQRNRYQVLRWKR